MYIYTRDIHVFTNICRYLYNYIDTNVCVRINMYECKYIKMLVSNNIYERTYIVTTAVPALNNTRG